MKRPLTAFVFLPTVDDAEEILAWNDRHPDQPIHLTDDLTQATVYVFTGLAADEADERLDRGLIENGWPQLPIVWLAAGAAFYESVIAFRDNTPTDLNGVLRRVYGEVQRAQIIDHLSAAERALNDAASVVDRGDDEAYAYQPELETLRRLIAQLERGAFMTEP